MHQAIIDEVEKLIASGEYEMPVWSDGDADLMDENPIGDWVEEEPHEKESESSDDEWFIQAQAVAKQRVQDKT